MITALEARKLTNKPSAQTAQIIENLITGATLKNETEVVIEAREYPMIISMVDFLESLGYKISRKFLTEFGGATYIICWDEEN